MTTNYNQFLDRKAVYDKASGFEPLGLPLERPLFDFQTDIVHWALRRGRAAIFADCGLGKTAMQLAWANEVFKHNRKPVLILAPLAVAEQTAREGQDMGVEVVHVTSQGDVKGKGIFISNYEKLHRFDTSKFCGVVLDESSILKSYDGKTRMEVTNAFRETPYRLACTATPAPNDYMELGNHAEFVGAMTREEMLAMFFTHDGGDTSKWRLKGHAQSDFWAWLCSWAVNLRKPSDLGYSDNRFVLPPLQLHEHVVQSSAKMDGFLFALPASSLEERRNARKASLDERVQQAAAIINAHDEPAIAWCNLNSESEALADSIEGAVELTGSLSEEEKEDVLYRFGIGEIKRLVTKPVLSGFGLNWQHCALEVFVGLSDSYEQFYQAVRRCWRFGQRRPVHAHLVISDLEGAVLANIKRKESDSKRMAEEMVKHMADISSQSIRGTTRTVSTYNPKNRIELPEWLNK